MRDWRYSFRMVTFACCPASFCQSSLTRQPQRDRLLLITFWADTHSVETVQHSYCARDQQPKDNSVELTTLRHHLTHTHTHTTAPHTENLYLITVKSSIFLGCSYFQTRESDRERKKESKKARKKERERCTLGYTFKRFIQERERERERERYAP